MWRYSFRTRGKSDQSRREQEETWTLQGCRRNATWRQSKTRATKSRLKGVDRRTVWYLWGGILRLHRCCSYCWVCEFRPRTAGHPKRQEVAISFHVAFSSLVPLLVFIDPVSSPFFSLAWHVRMSKRKIHACILRPYPQTRSVKKQPHLTWLESYTIKNTIVSVTAPPRTPSLTPYKTAPI